MRYYETIYIVNPNLDSKVLKTILDEERGRDRETERQRDRQTRITGTSSKMHRKLVRL